LEDKEYRDILSTVFEEFSSAEIVSPEIDDLPIPGLIVKPEFLNNWRDGFQKSVKSFIETHMNPGVLRK